MVKRALKDFEFFISPNTWNTAQDLVQAGHVKNLREVEKNFWVSLVEDPENGGPYEVEVMITPQKIKAFTCECWTEGRRLMCPHIGAVLLRVRQYINQRTEERQLKQAENTSEKSSGKLNIPTLLAQVPPEALTEFVRDYARRDRDFSLALKTWFAASISDAENPWLLLLDTVTPKSGKLREPEYRRLRKTLLDLESQLEKALEQGHYPRVFQMASAKMHKLRSLVLSSEEPRRGQLLYHYQLASKSLLDLAGHELSPELHDDIWTFVFDHVNKGVVPPESSRDVLKIIAARTGEAAKFDRVNSWFDETPHPVPTFVLYLYLYTLSLRGRPEAVKRVLNDYAAQPSVVKDAVAQLYYLNAWDAAKFCGNAFLEQGIFNAGQAREVEDLMLLIAEKQEDTSLLVQLLGRRYLHSGQPDLLEKMKKAAGKKWQDEKMKLLENMKSKGDLRAVAGLLAAENDTLVLAALLQEHPDHALLQKYASVLLPAHAKMVQEQYVYFLGDYLNEHFGPQAATWVGEQLRPLVKQGETALVKNIVSALEKQFPDRNSLSETLSELFQPNNRSLLTSIFGNL